VVRIETDPIGYGIVWDVSRGTTVTGFNEAEESDIDAFLEGLQVDGESRLSYRAPFKPGDPREAEERTSARFLNEAQDESLTITLLPAGVRGEGPLRLGEGRVERVRKTADGILLRWVAPASRQARVDDDLERVARSTRRMQ
jgi:hypothetical protein